jgi:arginine-tRNA-protein transferase
MRQRSLGTYMILWLIGRAKQLGLPYAYLGYWIGGSQKMAYKDKFRPLEYYAGESWKQFSDSMIENGLEPAAE